MKNCFKILSAGIALVLCAFAVTSCEKGVSLEDVKEDPLDAVESAYEEYVDAIDSKYGSFFDVFDEAEDGISSHEIKLSIPETFDAELDLGVDSDNGLWNGLLKYSSPELDAEITLWSDGDNTALSFPALLGEGNYGVKLSTLEDDIKDSPVFDGSFTYDDFKTMIPEWLSMTADEISDRQSDMLDSGKYQSDVEKILDGIVPVVLEENAGGVGCVSVEYVIPAEKVSEFLKNALDDMDGELSLINSVFDMNDAFSDMDDVVADDVTVKWYISKNSGAIYKSTVTIGDICLDVDYSADLSKPLNIAVNGTVEGSVFTAELKE